MNFRGLVDMLRKYWPIIVGLVIVLVPAIWAIASIYHSGQIDALREQVNLLREQKEFLERKLREASPTGTGPARPSDLPPATESKPGARSYPTPENPQRPSKVDIRQLAEFYGLTRRWRANQHLQYQEGDISYWYEQNLDEEQLRLEFESRRIVLERAESAGERIETQGDLSYLAEKVRATLLQTKAREKK